MFSTATHRNPIVLLIVLFCISAAYAVPAQESRTYHYQGRLIDLEVVPDRIAVHFHAGMDLESVLDAVRGEGIGVTSSEPIPSLDMAILTLDQEVEFTTFQQQLTGLPEVLCAAPLYSSGTARCTIRDTVMACFSKDIPADVRRAVAFRSGARIVRAFSGLEGWVQLRCLEPGTRDPFAVAKALLEIPGVQHAHPDFIHLVPKCAVPNDTHFSKQWALNKIDAPRGWDMHTGDANIVIAVLDDGVDTRHEDLSTKIVSPYDATDGDTNQEPNAWDGHGTACAGIAAAATNNGKGVAGVSWKSKIMPIRIGYSLQATPGTMIMKDEWTTSALLTAALKGADVVSNSWGGMTPTGIITAAIRTVKTAGRGGKGCVMVFPTGNGNTAVQYPATLPEVIAVGSTDESDARVATSNFGPEIDVVAPGVNLWTTDITGTAAGYNKGGTYDPTGNYYNAFGGTSAAAPHVAGLAALILSRNPGLSPDAVQDVIQRTAEDVNKANYPGKDNYIGHGRINVDKALQEVRFIPVRGTIAQDTTWTTGHVYLIENTVTVASTVTLTVQAGVVVKFKYQKGILSVQGNLDLQSSSGNEAVFTSERDDTYGGDTNGDGKATSPAAGDWYYISIWNARSTLHDAIFRYGGYHDNTLGMVWAYKDSPDIKDCRFEHARTVGLYYHADATEPFEVSGNTFDTCPTAFKVVNTVGQGRFHGNTIKGSIWAPVVLLDGAMVDFGTANTLIDTPASVVLVSGTISNNLTWKKIFFGTREMPYRVSGTLIVDASTILTIEAEVVVKFKIQDSRGQLDVEGDLKLNSSAGKEVVFTSTRDDTYGGDSNGDGDKTKPAPGDWYNVRIFKSNTHIHDAIFRYGNCPDTNGMVKTFCSPTFTSCRFEHALNTGLFYLADPLVPSTLSMNTFDSCPNAVTFESTDPATRFSGNTIKNCSGHPVHLLDSAMLIFENNNSLVDTPNSVIAVSRDMNSSVTWPRINFGSACMPYLVNGSLKVLSGATLTIESDVVVKFAYQKGSMRVNGDLAILGSPGKEVVFTSERDDTYGGDSNGDGGKTKPAAGDWYFIDLVKGLSSLHDAVFRYGGYGTNTVTMVGIYGCSPDVRSCRFEHALKAALHYDADPLEAFEISGNAFVDCPTAIRLKNTNTASEVKGNTITGCTSYPIQLLDGAMVNFQSNTIAGSVHRLVSVSGKITGKTTWPRISLNSTVVPYLVTGTLIVQPGGALTIEEEVVVKMKYQNGAIDVDGTGTLTLNGSPGKEVVFTSERDDTHGGDSNGDGDLTKPAPGDWVYVYIGGPSNLHDAVFRYGGAGGTNTKGMVRLDNLYEIRDCRFEHVENVALWCDGKNATSPSSISGNTFDAYNTAIALFNTTPATVVKGNTITGSTYYPVQLLDGAVADFQNNTITGSVHRVIAVSGEVSQKSITWKPVRFGETDMPYLVNGMFRVKKGATLTIDAGVVVKLKYQKGYFEVYGELKLLGTPGKEVVFTSERDDSHGGDSNGDKFLTRPAPGDWLYLYVYGSGTASLHDALFRYGGYDSQYSKGMVWIHEGSPDINNCRFEFALATGLYYSADENTAFSLSGNTFYLCPTAITLFNTDPASVLKGNILEGCTNPPIRLQDGAQVVFQNNELKDSLHKVLAVTGTIRKDMTWSSARIGVFQVPYLVYSTLTVNPAVTLTIDPGVVVKFSKYDHARLIVRGDLKLKGDQGNRIVFTSALDDEHGGDSNGDGRSTVPAKGDWSFISLHSSNTVFENALVRYGGYMSSDGMVHVNSCSPTIRNCRFEHAGYRAISYYPEQNKISFPLLENLQVLDSSGVTISDSASGQANVTVRNCHVNTDSGDALNLKNLNSRCILTGLTVRGRNNGISLTNAKPTIRNSIIHNCGIHGIQELDADSDPVLDHNCLSGSVSGQYYDHDTAAALNTTAAINGLNPPASNTGNIVADPLFVKGPQGNYYLSHTATGHVADSPCIDHGNPVEPKNVVHGTTRIDHCQDTGKPDLGYHHAMDLDADVYSIDVSRQGQVKLHLAAGGKNAGRQYLIGCSLSGSVPGTELGGLQVPLNLDPVTLIVIPLYGSPMFVDFSGFLDGNGTARPVFDTLGPNPGLKGLTLTMAAVLPFHYASNPIDIKFQ